MDKKPFMHEFAETGEKGAFLGIEDDTEGKQYATVIYAPMGFEGAFKVKKLQHILRSSIFRVTRPDGTEEVLITSGPYGKQTAINQILPELGKSIKELEEIEKGTMIKQALLEEKLRKGDQGLSDKVSEISKISAKLSRRKSPYELQKELGDIDD